MPQVRKNKYLSAIYSFLVWGLGEMYAGISNLKIGIGIVMMILWICFLTTSFLLNIHPLITTVLYIVIGLILAFDSYRDAELFNIKIKLEEVSRRAPDRCPNCGSKIEGNPRFCPNCGYKLVI